MEGVFRSGRLALAYEKHGLGDHLILFLHGYGKSRADFRELCINLSSGYTAVSIDLPFHGNSPSELLQAGAMPLDKKEWKDWLNSFISELGHTRFSVVAFSLGARFALCYAESSDQALQKMILLAPDGFIVNPWNFFFTRNLIGVCIFNWAMANGKFSDSLVLGLARLKIISDKRKKIIMDNIKGDNSKEKLFRTWVFLSLLWPKRSFFKKQGELQWKDLQIILGRHDSVIPFKAVKSMIPAMYLDDVLTALNTGHDMMNQRSMDALEEIIKTSVPQE